MEDGNALKVGTPRIAAQGRLKLAGLSGRYTQTSAVDIPLLWDRFVTMMGTIPGQVGHVSYGVCCNADGAGGFEYIAAVEVADFGALPDDLGRIELPARRYAVFTHAGHVSGLPATVRGVWRALPTLGLAVASAPDFERYGPAFDGRTGMGEVEIWIPLKD